MPAIEAQPQQTSSELECETFEVASGRFSLAAIVDAFSGVEAGCARTIELAVPTDAYPDLRNSSNALVELGTKR